MRGSDGVSLGRKTGPILLRTPSPATGWVLLLAGPCGPQVAVDLEMHCVSPAIPSPAPRSWIRSPGCTFDLKSYGSAKCCRNSFSLNNKHVAVDKQKPLVGF